MKSIIVYQVILFCLLYESPIPVVCRVSGKSLQTAWKWDTHGHYYLAYETLGEPDLTKRGKRKEFMSKIEPDVKHVQVILGKLSEAELESVVSSLQG